MQGPTQAQARDQLLLFSGSSAGCVALHAQSVQALGEAQMQPQGRLIQGDLMPGRKTLHPVDLLGVTCLAVKRVSSTPSGIMGSCVVCTQHLASTASYRLT